MNHFENGGRTVLTLLGLGYLYTPNQTKYKDEIKMCTCKNYT